MMQLPTRTAEAIAKASNIDEIISNSKPGLFREALGHFQRLALVADYDTAFKVLNPYLDRKPDEQQSICLKLIHDLARKDVLGLAVEELVNIVKGGGIDSKTKTTAAAILNDLYGENKLIEETKLTDKLTINL